MKILKKIALVAFLICFTSCHTSSKELSPTSTNLVFQEDTVMFSETQKSFILNTVLKSEAEVRDLLPSLPDSIKVIIENVDWNLDAVGGVTGRAESNSPPLVMIQISRNYKDGVIDSVYPGLKATIFHEFHHMMRGWAIQDNKFGPGIPNAMVNEGLAVVFAETQTGVVQEVDGYSDVTDEWVQEIMKLPLDASYSDWVMGEHPDGRTYIGYRTGNYLIRKAMGKSGKNIVELSALTPEEIIKIAGF